MPTIEIARCSTSERVMFLACRSASSCRFRLAWSNRFSVDSSTLAIAVALAMMAAWSSVRWRLWR
jgi:hypothetical protein